MLSTDPRLAGLLTEYIPGTGQFHAYVGEHLVLSCDLTTARGRSRTAELFAAVLDLPKDKAPVVVLASNQNFAYLDSSSCHVVNLASVRDLSERVGVDIDPLRFRANLYVDTGMPWSEFEWIGQEVAIGGEVRLKPSGRAARCAATEVNRATGVRDLPIPKLLQRHYGHSDFGIYAAISNGGLLEPGMAVFQATETGAVL